MTAVAQQKCPSERDPISRYLTAVCPVTTTVIITTNAAPVIEAEKLGLMFLLCYLSSLLVTQIIFHLM